MINNIVKEKAIIYKALKDGDLTIFAEIDNAVLFNDKINSCLWKLALELEHKNFDSLHLAISDSKYQHKDILHSTLNDIEKGLHFYDEYFLKDLYTNFQIREYKKFGETVSKVGDGKITIEEAKKRIEQMYLLTQDLSTLKKQFVTLNDIENEIQNRTAEQVINNKIVVPTITLREIFGDKLHPRFYILAGLRSLGKNIVVDRLVSHLIGKHKVVYFSYDNSAKETAYMINSILSGMSFNKLETGLLNDYEKEKAKLSPVIKRNLLITSQRDNIDKMRVKLERLKSSMEHNDIKLFVIDYIQNIPFRSGYKGDKIGEYTHMASTLNQICSDLGITCIALSQSNDREKVDNVKFHINDVKGAGAWSESAFYVVGLEGEQSNTMRQANIVKNKRGSIKRVQFEMDFVKKDVMPWGARMSS